VQIERHFTAISKEIKRGDRFIYNYYNQTAYGFSQQKNQIDPNARLLAFVCEQNIVQGILLKCRRLCVLGGKDAGLRRLRIEEILKNI